jgi:hypothetical protein
MDPAPLGLDEAKSFPRGRTWPNPHQRVGRGETRVQGVRQDRAHALGVGRGKSYALGVKRSHGHASNHLGMLMSVTISSFSPDTPSATREAVSVGEGGITVRGIGALGASSESSRALNPAGGDSQALGEPLLTLDDAAEDMERESINVGVSSALEALMNATGLLRDVVTPAGQVPCDPASRPSSRWIFVSLTHVSHSLLWLIAGRSPGSCVSKRTPRIA